MSLYGQFFEAAKLDLAAAEDLTKTSHCQPALYHLEQAYEKCIKSYFIFKDSNPETTIYTDLKRKLGHEIEDSTIMLLKDMADKERQDYMQSLGTTNPQERQSLQNAIVAIDNYKMSLDRVVQRLDLGNNYINNIRNYLQYVKKRYQDYQSSVNAIATQPETSFFNIVLCMACIYPCLYKMASISRYPLREFGYDNMNLLNNQTESCRMIIEMLGDLMQLVANDLNS